jgi:hypothetical protein
VFQYEVIKATNAQDLVGWLTEHHYRAPENIEGVLVPYIRAGYHFLAMRIRPDRNKFLTLAPHPICYTYAAETLVYPMIISSPSAARENEVVIYVLGSMRYACANWNNVTLSHMSIATDSSAPSGTTYESEFRKLGIADPHVFVTEYASKLFLPHNQKLLNLVLDTDGDLRADVKVGRANDQVLYLTRLRALISPSAMDRDVLLVPAAMLPNVSNHLETESRQKSGETWREAVFLVCASTCALAAVGRARRKTASRRDVWAVMAVLMGVLALCLA